MKKTGKLGRPSHFTEELTKQIVNFLGGAISIRSTCAALGISERSFYAHCERDSAFDAEIQRARALGKIKLIREIVTDRDWKAKSWYLSVCYPEEFARTEDRRLPEEVSAAANQPPMKIILSMPDGKTQPVSFKKAAKIFAGDFPIRDEPPSDESETGNDRDSS
jgi:hypothetical protein